MNSRKKSTAGSYARAVERSWSRFCGRAVILSPRDWSIVEKWYSRGIPLQVVLEAIEAAAERRGKGRSAQPEAPRSLAYIAAAVEEGWVAVLEGRRSSQDARECEGSGERPDIDGWRERMRREEPGSPLHVLLSGLIEAFEGGEKPAELDRRLDMRISEVVSRELFGAVEKEVEHQMSSFRERMEPDIYEATRRRALSMRLRHRLGLNKLA